MKVKNLIILAIILFAIILLGATNVEATSNPRNMYVFGVTDSLDIATTTADKIFDGLEAAPAILEEDFKQIEIKELVRGKTYYLWDTDVYNKIEDCTLNVSGVTFGTLKQTNTKLYADVQGDGEICAYTLTIDKNAVLPTESSNGNYSVSTSIDGWTLLFPSDTTLVDIYPYLQGEDTIEIEKTKVYKIGSTYNVYGWHLIDGRYQEDKIIELPAEYKILPAKNGEYSIDSTGRKLTFLKSGLDMEIYFSTDGTNEKVLDWYTVASEEEWESYTTNKVTGATTEAIKNGIEENKTTKVEMTTPTKVEKEVFTELKNTKGSTLEISTGIATWEFNSEDVTNTNITFDPEVVVSDKKFSDIESNEITDAIFIEFKHNGNLPGKATVTMNIGTDKYGEGKKTLHLYYYNEETKEHEFIQDVQYDNGVVTFTLTHCSTYSLTAKKLETGSLGASSDADPKKDNTPDMGVTENFVVIATLLTVISAGAVVSIKRMK